jgi:hypothetical protein
MVRPDAEAASPKEERIMIGSRRLFTLIGAAAVSLLASGIETEAAKAPKTAAVFVHVASDASSCTADNTFSVLDHPLANGNPDAVILAIVNEGNSSEFGGLTASGPVSVFYDDAGLCTTNRWVLIAGSAIPAGARFNVSVTTP